MVSCRNQHICSMRSVWKGTLQEAIKDWNATVMAERYRKGGKSWHSAKKIRLDVYAKYGGRCAYCGRKIAYKDMQVDHFIAKKAFDQSGSDDISNLMPSCRMCNHYKRANSLELFRRYIQEIPRKLRENYIYKIGVVYGNVVENQKPIEFYFEKEGKHEKNYQNPNESGLHVAIPAPPREN